MDHCPWSVLCVIFQFDQIIADVRGITAAYLIAKGSLLLLFCFFLLCSAQYCRWNKQDLGVSSSSCFWPSSFVLVFSWNGEFGAEHECVFKGCMHLSASHLHVIPKIPQVQRGILASWCFTEGYIWKGLPWLSSHSEASTFLTFPNQSEPNFHVQRVCFQWIRPKAGLF